MQPPSLKMHSIIGLCVVAMSLHRGRCLGLRDSELSSATQELTMVLRGLRADLSSNFERLLSDLHQERLTRTEHNMALRDKVEENRLDIEALRGQIAAMTKTSGCPKNLDTLAGIGRGGARKPPEGVKAGVAVGSGGGGGGGGSVSVGRGITIDSRRGGTPIQMDLESPFKKDKGEEEAKVPVPVSPAFECPPPFQRAGEHCLKILKERMAWDAARTQCHSYAQLHTSHLTGSPKINGDLVVPHDIEAFKHFIKTTDFSGTAWVGASTEGWAGAWAWIDGSLIKELPWLYSQPGLNGGLLAVDSEATFHTVELRETFYPICELTQ